MKKERGARAAVQRLLEDQEGCHAGIFNNWVQKVNKKDIFVACWFLVCFLTNEWFHTFLLIFPVVVGTEEESTEAQRAENFTCTDACSRHSCRVSVPATFFFFFL